MPGLDSSNISAIITGVSTIAGISITQFITGRNNRLSEKRKEEAENRRLQLVRKIEVGEHFYHVFRESQLNILRLQKLFKLGIEITNKDSEKYLLELQLQISESAKKLINDTPNYNVTEIYYPIESSTIVTANDVNILTQLITDRIELTNNMEEADNIEKYKIVVEVKAKTQEIIQHLKTVDERIMRDLSIVKNSLINLITALNS